MNNDPLPVRELSTDLALPTQQYSTDNLDLAAWLVCLGLRLLRLDPPDPFAPKLHTRFVFPGSLELTEAVGLWESGQPVPEADLRRYVGVKKDLFSRARAVARGVGR